MQSVENRWVVVAAKSALVQHYLCGVPPVSEMQLVACRGFRISRSGGRRHFEYGTRCMRLAAVLRLCRSVCGKAKLFRQISNFLCGSAAGLGGGAARIF